MVLHDATHPAPPFAFSYHSFIITAGVDRIRQCLRRPGRIGPGYGSIQDLAAAVYRVALAVAVHGHGIPAEQQHSASEATAGSGTSEYCAACV